MLRTDRMRAAARAGSLALGLALVLVGTGSRAVILDGENECTVKLSDGTDVVLIGEFQSRMATRGVDGADEADLAVPALDRYRAPLDPARHVASRSVGQMATQAAGEAYDAVGGAQGLAAMALRSQYAAPDFREHVKTNRFYYLPPGNSLHLSQRPNGVPEFLFVKYTSDKAQGAQGGLMHFLMEWSLTADQEEELRRKVSSQCQVNGEDGELVGHVPLDEASEQGSFRIISAVLADQGMTRSLVQSGHAPTLPGGKVAAATNLSSDGAQLFLATVAKSRSIADLSVELDYSYVVQLPAAKGEIVFHWDRFQELRDEFDATYSQSDYNGRFLWWGSESHTYSEEEVSNTFNTMVENSVVEFIFEGYNPDSEYTGKIMEAMLQYFTNSMMQPADPSMATAQTDDEEQEPDRPELEESSSWGRTSQTYTINRTSLEQAFAVKEQRIRLDAGLAVRRPFQVVGNLASWYNSVKDNRDCVQEVNLSDPFFQHRDIRFILDLDAKEIFEDVINYVTVNVKKERQGQPEFNDSVTIDADYLKKSGITASMTYARGNERGTEAYQYQTQWSLKGGNVWPRNARWERGSWEGVTLAPPVERWFVEVEGDVDEMAANDIVRVTAELHYPLFGEEKFAVMALSPSKGTGLVGEHIYVDRGTKGFAYRLIIHHKKEGRMVLPWQTRIGERYVYASLPPELLVAESPIKTAAKEAAKKLGKPGADQVLDQFAELFAEAQ